MNKKNLLTKIISVVFSAIMVLSASTLFGCGNAPTSGYTFNGYVGDYYNVVDFELTYNKDAEFALKSIWFYLGGKDNTTDSEKIAFKVMSSTTSGEWSTYYNLNEKTLSNSKDSVGKWIELYNDVIIQNNTSSTSSRTWIRVATKNIIKVNELVFVDSDGKVLTAVVKDAGAVLVGDITKKNPQTVPPRDPKVIKSANKLINEQKKFSNK